MIFLPNQWVQIIQRNHARESAKKTWINVLLSTFLQLSHTVAISLSNMLN